MPHDHSLFESVERESKSEVMEHFPCCKVVRQSPALIPFSKSHTVNDDMSFDATLALAGDSASAYL